MLIKFWEAENLNDVSVIEDALVRAAERANATILKVHAHKFTVCIMCKICIV
ncbi:S-adenosylmethionine decarboxylase [Rhodospirillales bacterium]|nr:S-adenosylmethionine decarboxylase [Rhodospirillales bacterium]